MSVGIRRRPLVRSFSADDKLGSSCLGDVLKPPIPWQEAVDALGGMIREASQPGG
jgi:hypothetical protein